MSELSATNCGCGCDNNSSIFGGNRNGCGISSCALIIILLFFCGGMGNTWGRSGSDCDCDNSWIWIILLLFFCNGNNGCGC